MCAKIKRTLDGESKGIWIPVEVWNDNDLTINEIILLVKINSLNQSKDGCFASNANLGKYLGLSISRISEMITELTGKGYIEWIENLSYKTTRILKIIKPFDISNGSLENRGSTIRNSEKTLRDLPMYPSENAKHNNKDNNKENNKESNIYLKKNKFSSNHLDLNSKVELENLTEEQKDERFNAIYRALKKDEKWLYNANFALKIGKNATMYFLIEFLNEIKAKEEFHKPLKDIKAYYINWYKSNNLKKQY